MTDVSVHPNGAVKVWPNPYEDAKQIVIKRGSHDGTHWVEIHIGDFKLTVFGKPDLDIQCPVFGHHADGTGVK